MTGLPTPHLDKLNATIANEKLPNGDRVQLEKALRAYANWVANLTSASGATIDETVAKMVELLNEYRLFLDLEAIFDSNDDFLYRQKGQLKIDNSVIEEFLPHLISKCVTKEIEQSNVGLGPTTAFSAVYFTSSLENQLPGGGLHVRTKDQDFAIGKKLYLRASHDPDFHDCVTKEFYLGYVVAECKTNLDKTMFQEACATVRRRLKDTSERRLKGYQLD